MPTNRTDAVFTTRSPATFIPGDNQDARPQPGIALCLSGGGYRAMLFHLGALLRLNELGFLPKLDRISSVSGGSILAGCLGMNWNALDFDGNGIARNLRTAVIDPIRALAGRTIDAGAVIGGFLLPGNAADRVVASYRKHLFGDKTLQDFPDKPRFVINATNVQSGVLWRFSKPFMADYRVGMIPNPKLPLSVAVAASSAFPPVLSPLAIDLEDFTFTPGSGLDLQREPYTTEAVLTDGGVYDNLGLETAWKRYKTVLVSDGGAGIEPEEEPKRDWGRHAYRILTLIDNQVRSLRKRQLINSLKEHEEHDGAYWGIRTHIADYQVASPLNCPEEKTRILADTPTRLERLPAERQEKLINWGYAVCDAAVRKHVSPSVPAPTGFPYREAGI